VSRSERPASLRPMATSICRSGYNARRPGEVPDAELEVTPGKPLKRTRLLCFLAVFALSLFGRIPNARAEERTRRRPNECSETASRFVTERLQIWRQRLKLDEWKFSIVFAHPSGLHPNTVGNIRWDASEKSAVIRILDAMDYQIGCRDTLDDMEFTIVHELLHLKVSSLPRYDSDRNDEESMVNDLARALLMLDRTTLDRYAQ
jgi:hypothetical protein